jgi:hypothetical protein
VLRPCNPNRSCPFTETRQPGRAAGPMPSLTLLRAEQRRQTSAYIASEGAGGPTQYFYSRLIPDYEELPLQHPCQWQATRATSAGPHRRLRGRQPWRSVASRLGPRRRRVLELHLPAPQRRCCRHRHIRHAPPSRTPAACTPSRTPRWRKTRASGGS